MKRLILIVISLCITMSMQAQVSKTVNVTAGGLSTALTPAELNTVTNLTLTGTIDARDFKNMRDNMPLLTELDLSGATVAAYSGTEGTNSINFNYPANEVPVQAFYKLYSEIMATGIGKSSLTSVILPPSVTFIGELAFSECVGLTSLTIPTSVNSIGDDAFNGCTGLTSINIPTSVTSIGDGAFFNCRGLTSLTIPISVTHIGSYSFRYCTGLTSLTIPTSITSISYRAFQDCTGLTSVTLPSSVTSIGPSAFDGCTGLTSITLPPSVTSIGDYAFNGCTGLTSINLLPLLLLLEIVLLKAVPA